MKISERLALLKAGYSKAEINEMIEAEAASVTSPEEQASQVLQQDDGVMAVLNKLATEVKDMKTAIHKENIANTEMKTGGSLTAEEILASLINPPEKGN